MPGQPAATALGPTPSEIPVHTGTSTLAPPYPTMRFSTDAPSKISEADWSALSNDLASAVNASITARGPLEQNLKEWSDAYDMITPDQENWPFEDASNIQLPYMPAQLESLVAYIAGTVLVPRLYIVTGNTPQAAGVSYRVEKFYNAELTRLRSDGSSYFSRHVDWLHMSLRDGTCVLEVLWNRRRQRKRSVMYVPKRDPQTGIVQMAPDGQPLWEEQVNEVDVFVKDYAELTPVPLKEFILIPDEARSIEDAVGVGRVEWLYEDQLDRMVRAGLLDSDEVERALVYVQSGGSDVAADRQGTYDKSASEQIGIGQGQGSIVSRFFVNRGPLKVWRIHSRQFDMNGDGVPEENIFWLHEQSGRMLGWMPYDYASGQRPFFAFSPFPRPDRFYGFSLPERLAGVSSEMDLNHNARNNQIAFRLQPPMGVQSGSELLNKKGQWRPGAMIEMESLEESNPSMRILTQPDVPLSSWQEEALLKSYGNDYTGLSQPAMGTQSNGKRSATELRQQNAGQGTRINLICTRFRIAAGQVINFVHQLNKQYLQSDPETVADQQYFKLGLDELAQDFTIGIAGATDPIDSVTRRNENMTLFELLMKVPFVAQNPMRVWYALRSLLESFGRADIYQLIGTEQDAQMMVQQMQAAAQAQQAAAAGQQPQNGPPQGAQQRAA